MQDKYRKQWETLGVTDPYWAVLTDPTKKNDQWNHEDFFRSGEEEIERIGTQLKKFSMEITSNIALDFGCGVGRVSRALAKRFNQVIAIDISTSMLKENKLLTQHHDIRTTTT